jgi:predicted O-methyltransferase YrrM
MTPMDFQKVLRKHFKSSGNVVSGRAERQRNHGRLDRGRWALAYAMADMEFRTGVEIGTQYGDSAEIWCTANSSLHLTCIDPYGLYRKRREKNLQDSAYEDTCKRLDGLNVTLLRKASLEVVDSFQDESLDFVHVDGDHTFDACICDVIKWVPKVRKEGLILVHDYYSLNWIGVTQALEAYLRAHRIDPWYVTPDGARTVFWQRGAERWVRTI